MFGQIGTPLFVFRGEFFDVVVFIFDFSNVFGRHDRQHKGCLCAREKEERKETREREKIKTK